MSDSKLKTDYENAALNVAVSDMLKQHGRELEEEYVYSEELIPFVRAIEKFEKELNIAYIKDQILSLCKKTAKFIKYAVIVCAAFITAFAVFVFSVDEFRLGFGRWLIGLNGSHSSLDFFQNNSNTVPADYLPDGYELTNYNKSNNEIEICYSSSTKYIKIQVYSDAYTFNSDAGDTSTEEIYINGNKGLYQSNDLMSAVLWRGNENAYCVSTNDTQITSKHIGEAAPESVTTGKYDYSVKSKRQFGKKTDFLKNLTKAIFSAII